ncbi:Uncharacterised protein [Nocardia otitidiscaviarum]|uniref:Uncharacterized protein n=1 Tax=Nocardia otitidiscaviarum TaxID=1823 RepID=A0A379JLZ5_9NOCA|nr:hypothetical protein [Nocardia otitidiscaviarum]SUD49528.1 Uncharacterised protein [Nocardia otitidiscaviarum]
MTTSLPFAVTVQPDNFTQLDDLARRTYGAPLHPESLTHAQAWRIVAALLPAYRADRELRVTYEGRTLSAATDGDAARHVVEKFARDAAPRADDDRPLRLTVAPTLWQRLTGARPVVMCWAPPTADSGPAADDQDAAEHRYEDHGKIYFYFAEGRWHLDSTSLDGYPLDGLGSLDCTYGGCPDRCTTCKTPEATAEREQADATPLPTGREVLDMLAEWYGYTLVRTDRTAEAARADQLLADFRADVRAIEDHTARYTDEPGSDQDAAVTARYADARAELYEHATETAERLHALASAGHLPKAWTTARTAQVVAD